MKFLRRIKKRWNAYLEKMSETNKKLYGGKKLDCCTINSKTDSEYRPAGRKN